MEEPAQSEQSATSNRANIAAAADFIAIACVWSWWYLMSFSGVNLLDLPYDLKVEPWFRTVFFSGTVVAFIVLMLLRRKLSSRGCVIALLVIALVCEPWPTMLTLSTTEYSSTLFITEIFAWVAAGISAGILMFFGSRFNREAETHQYLLRTSVAAIIGGVIYLGITFMDSTAGLVALIVLPVIAILFFCLGNNLQVLRNFCGISDDMSVKEVLAASIKLRPADLLDGFICGLGLCAGISISHLYIDGFLMGIVVAICVSGLVGVVIWFVVKKRGVSFDKITWYQAAISASLLLLMILNDMHVTLVACVLLSLVCTVYDLIHTSQSAEYCDAMSSPFVFAGIKAFYYLGIALGWGVMTFLWYKEGADTSQFNVVIMVIVILALFVITASALRKMHVAIILPDQEPENTAQRTEEILQEMAEGAGLTPRQVEVFAYLAKGRNASYISDKLVLSNHTVKAHIYRIYQKLDVHTQQELIDMVESKLA